jgi:hypothetical protein
MELFTTSLKQAPIITREQVERVDDMHGESNVCGYCEFCWGWDYFKNLIIIHDLTLPDASNNHSMGHQKCIEALKGWEYCKC